ncbi:MAG: hypothetical protein R3E89_16540 [Thiolinea sp.]
MEKDVTSIVNNLIENAVKHTPAGSRIEGAGRLASPGRLLGVSRMTGRVFRASIWSI